MNSPEAFYLHIQGEQRGPYTIRHIDHLLNSGLITEEALFWREGLEQWQPVTRLVSKRPRRSRIKGLLSVLLVLLIVTGAGSFFGPVLLDGWREIYQHDFTAEAAYWRAREVVRSQMSPEDGFLSFEAFPQSQVELRGNEEAQVRVDGTVSAAGKERSAQWRVFLKYDKTSRQWTGQNVAEEPRGKN